MDSLFIGFAVLVAIWVLLMPTPTNRKQADRMQRLEALFYRRIAPLVRELDAMEAEAHQIRAKLNPSRFVSTDDQWDGLGESPAATRAREIRKRALPGAFTGILEELQLPVDHSTLATVHLGAMSLWSDRAASDDHWHYRSDLERLLAK